MVDRVNLTEITLSAVGQQCANQFRVFECAKAGRIEAHTCSDHYDTHCGNHVLCVYARSGPVRQVIAASSSPTGMQEYQKSW